LGSGVYVQTVTAPDFYDDGELPLVRMLQKLEAKQTLLAQQAAAAEAAAERAEKIDATIKRLRKYVGHTPYVFSGITPSGWDCSGLTLWFYDQALGIEIKHSAGDQAKYGTVVTDPAPGDIVAFYYTGQKRPYHVGIYVGDNMFIHAPKPDRPTSIDNAYTWANNTEVAYIRY
jgi:cell wall-associated NlpC family hydrolase